MLLNNGIKKGFIRATFHHAGHNPADGLIVENSVRDLCITPLFVQFLRQAQILHKVERYSDILEILNVFLWLKFSPSLNLSKNEHSANVSVINFRWSKNHDFPPRSGGKS
jgi:hypothetical protein